MAEQWLKEAVAKDQKRQQEYTMYGCSADEFKRIVEDSITFRLSGPSMIVAGLMSDAQEEMAHGMIEQARQTLNRAKLVLFDYVDV